MRKLGSITLSSPFILAPMAGVTNSVFRTICKRFGASLVFSEMISDKGLIYKNQNTFDLLKTSKEEHPVGIQLFGSSSTTLSEALDLVIKNSQKDGYAFDLIDINMGCPVNKVVKSGAGSALLNDLDNLKDIVETIRKKTDMPFTIKIRAGWDTNSINCDEVAKIADSAKVDALTIHARTRSQLYRGTVNLDYIKRIRVVSDIFLIGSGDIKDIEDANKYFDAGCDAVMIGRSSLGNPWIFKKLLCEYNNEEFVEPSVDEVIEVLLEHATKLVELIGESRAMVEMRTHSVWYFKHLPNSKQYRLKLVHTKTLSELIDICEEYKQSNKKPQVF